MRSGAASQADESNVTLALAVIAVTCALVLLGVFAGQAFAASTSPSFEKAQQPAEKRVQLATSSIQKSYPSASKMIITMEKGDSTTVRINNGGVKVKWSVTNSKVAKVKKKGSTKAKITGLKVGKTTICAKSGKKKFTCKVNVIGTLSTTSITTTPLQSAKLALKNVTAKTWATSNASVAKVDVLGNVTPVSAGSATITCTDKFNNSYACAVKVKRPNITCKVINGNLFSEINGFKKFTFANHSGKNLSLNTHMRYYPALNSTTSSMLYTCASFGPDTNGDYQGQDPFIEQPLYSNNTTETSFFAQNENAIEIASEGCLKLGFTCEGIQYFAAFSPYSGSCLACARVS